MGVGELESFGIPYFFQMTKDKAPRSVRIVVEVSDGIDDNIVSISRVEIDSASSKRVIVDAPQRLQDGHKWSEEDDRTSYGVRLPDAVEASQRCRLRVAGTVKDVASKETHVFDVTLDVPFEREDELVIGWAKLLYYNHF